MSILRVVVPYLTTLSMVRRRVPACLEGSPLSSLFLPFSSLFWPSRLILWNKVIFSSKTTHFLHVILEYQQKSRWITKKFKQGNLRRVVVFIIQRTGKKQSKTFTWCGHLINPKLTTLDIFYLWQCHHQENKEISLIWIHTSCHVYLVHFWTCYIEVQLSFAIARSHSKILWQFSHFGSL